MTQEEFDLLCKEFDDKGVGYCTLVLPDWMLCYLYNGDSEGLTEDEIATFDSWFEEMGKEYDMGTISCVDESYFSPYNDVTELAGDCTDAIVLRYRDDK